MILCRKRAFFFNLLTLGLAFIAGCTITLSVINVKNCKTDFERQHLTSNHNVSTSAIFLVIVVLSAPKNIDQRNTIRQTWLNLKPKIDESHVGHRIDNFDSLEFDHSGFLQQDSIAQQSSMLDDFKEKMSKAIYKPMLEDLNVKILHYFVIGTENLPFIELNKLEKEHAKHNDLLFLSGLSDSYTNLTLKLLKTIEAVSNIGTFEYMLKVDDDTYVKLDYLLQDLHRYDKLIKRKQSTENTIKPELYWGYFNGRATVLKQGQWKELNFNLCDRYLPYALGGGYVISKNLVHFVAQNHKTLNRYVSEDISMGVWLSSLRNVYKKHDPRFDTAYLPRKCQNYHIVLHKRTPSNMRDIYRGLLCTFKQANATNIQRPKEYFYDWSSSPTHCCDTFVDQF
ncbi:beta-1,3-galactosyltransferase 6 [Contarinia nasturtii]|uniref:beta-1,3-galactosyltransferase 6 n=1 Tax=Contarinia nasturtii TaxID=265458 RepID=UPI0012D3D7E6|nr:beta-1,3-galactosyltransferase 6 [Contarinia nasturtii]